jgi:sugar lactone lactonase YvrE
MTELKVPGLRFPEGPRWRDGTWWLADQLGDRILRVDTHGDAESVCALSGPSGLGFLADGSLLVARMNEPSLVRVRAGTVEEVVDLRAVAGYLNDMFVGPDGRCYVDAYGDQADRSTHRLVLVAIDQPAAVVADDLAYPNGVAVTPDGRRLVLSETFAHRITVFDVGDDGTLGGRRVWAQLPRDNHPDGLCLDANGDVWVASYLSGEFLHLREGGELLERIAFPGRWALSCSLGGDDGLTLLLCTSETSHDEYRAGRGVGHLDTRRVDVPGVQRP